MIPHIVVKAARYPADNFFPGSLDDVGLVDRAQGGYRLADGSRFRRAGSGGLDPGVDAGGLARAMAAAGRPSPEPRLEPEPGVAPAPPPEAEPRPAEPRPAESPQTEVQRGFDNPAEKGR